MGKRHGIAPWVHEFAKDYFELIQAGYEQVEAAYGIQSAFGQALGGKSISTITRAMRAYLTEYGMPEIDQGLPGEDGSVSSAGRGPRGPAASPGPERRRPTPPPSAGTAFEPLVLPYRDTLVWCDTHVPFHLPKLMDQSIDSALAKGIKRIVLAGDFMDFHWASRFLSWGNEAGTHNQVRREFDTSQQIFETLLSTFSEVVIIPGNHDGGRFQHLTEGMFDFEMLCSMLGGYPISNKPEHLIIGMNRWMVMEGSPWGDWRITHPQSARSVPLALAEVLAWKYDMNVLTAHQHFLGVRMDRYGKHIVCDGGHFQDELLTDYKREVDNAYSNWTPGFVELVDGWPICTAKRR